MEQVESMRLIFQCGAMAWPTMFHLTGEILNPCYWAIVLPLWFVQLHSSPEASRELSAATKSQGSNLYTHITTETQNKYKHSVQNKAKYNQDMQQKNCPVHWTVCEIIKTCHACQRQKPFQKLNDILMRLCLLKPGRKAIKRKNRDQSIGLCQKVQER